MEGKNVAFGAPGSSLFAASTTVTSTGSVNSFHDSFTPFGGGIALFDIALEQASRMFVPFQRLGDTDNTTGIGLGLALSRGLTEAMDGTLEPEDTPGGGLTIAPAAGRSRHGARCPASTRSRAAWPRSLVTRVLVVDDEPQIIRALRINLRARHFEVYTAQTGTQALEEAAHHPPDLAILDLGLPDLDGVEVIGGLRGWTDAPIIVLSGRADSTDKVEALDAGADDYVTKPFGMDELLARMRGRPPQRSGGERTPGYARRPDHRPGRQARQKGRRGHQAHADRVAPARSAAAASGQAAEPAAAAARGLGTRLRGRDGKPQAVHGAAEAETRARSGQAALAGAVMSTPCEPFG